MMKYLQIHPVIFRLFILLGLPGASFADEVQPPPTAAMLAAQCAQCHGTEGNAVAGMKPLAGKDIDIIGMKNNEDHAIMHKQAKAYTDEQLMAISEYFASLTPSDEKMPPILPESKDNPQDQLEALQQWSEENGN